MFGPELRLWLLGLDHLRVVLFIRSLLLAEANRLRLPTGVVTITGEILAPDGGIDARSDLPEDAESVFPLGPRTWQIKKVKNKPDLAEEVTKPKLNTDLHGGRGYVFAWIREATDRQELEGWLADGIKNAGLDAASTLIIVDDLERLARVHPALIQAHGGPPVVALPFDRWSSILRPDEFPFQADDLRVQQVASIQAFAESASEQDTHLRVVGDTGVGKSRLVYEALRKDGLAERSAVAFSPRDVDEASLRALVMSTDSYLVLIVDDCSDGDAERLAHFADASRGRLRLITIGDRPERRPEPDPRTLEVTPLAEGLVTELVRQVANLRQEDAELVASLAQGYPKLAVELAHLVTHAAAPESVLDLLRSERIDRILNAMLPQADLRTHLGHLAIMERLGFDDELEIETDRFCETFGLNPMQFRAAIEQETGRFVTSVGRYRRVTPKALAVWLLYETVRLDPAYYGDRLASLPPALFSSFREQVELLGGNPLIDGVVREVLAQRADSFRDLDHLTVEGARLLYAATFAVPETAVDLIHNLIVSSSREQLESLADDRRRQLVWALQHLLWFRASFERAADSLLTLAVTENEPYANNATGVLIGAFQLLLGGTEVPFGERLAWLESRRARFGEQSALIAFHAAETALSVFQARSGGWGGSRRQPVEWRPSEIETAEAHRGAWRVLNELADQYPAFQLELAKAVDGLLIVPRPAVTVNDILEQTSKRAWTTRARAELTAGIRRVLEYGPLAPEHAAALRELMLSLEGHDLEQRARVAIATPFWQLGENAEDMKSGPQVVERLADELLANESVAMVVARVRDDVDDLSLFNIYRAIGTSDHSHTLEVIVSDPDTNRAARLGYLSGRGQADTGWADQVLHQWLDDPSLASDVPIAVSRLLATTRRLDLALTAVESERASARELAHLAVGSWVRPLEAPDVVRLLNLCIGSLGLLEPRFAFWILDSWLDEGREATDDLRHVAGELILASSASEDLATVHLSGQLGVRLSLGFDTRWSALLRRLQRRHIPTPMELDDLRTLAGEVPTKVASDLVDLITQDQTGWSLFLQSSSLLSVLGGEDRDPLRSKIGPLAESDQIRLLDHFDFKGEDLDPLVVELLEQHADSEDFRDAVSRRFAFPHQVVRGSYAAHLERRKSLLDKWSEEHPSAAVREWAGRLSPEFDGWIGRERRTEVEER
jgi:hypothetical protein